MKGKENEAIHSWCSIFHNYDYIANLKQGRAYLSATIRPVLPSCDAWIVSFASVAVSSSLSSILHLFLVRSIDHSSVFSFLLLFFPSWKLLFLRLSLSICLLPCA